MKIENNLNDQLYLKKEITDESIIKETSSLIDEWEARLPYSPIGTFSQDTRSELTSNAVSSLAAS